MAKIANAIEEKGVAISKEDSKRREAELREEVKELRREARRLGGTIEGIRVESFKNLLAEEYGLPRTHPKFDTVYSLAYSHGHGNGYSDVESLFSEFVELVQEPVVPNELGLNAFRR